MRISLCDARLVGGERPRVFQTGRAVCTHEARGNGSIYEATCRVKLRHVCAYSSRSALMGNRVPWLLLPSDLLL